MGNECCTRRSKESAFTDSEINYLRSLYNELTGPKRVKGKTRFNKHTLRTLFEESPDVSTSIYELMVHSGGDNKDVSYNTFELALEILLKDPNAVRLKRYKAHEKIDILALMMIRDYTHGKEDLKTISISYIRALDFVKVLLRIFQHDVSVPKPIDEYAARVIVDGVFREDQGQTDWWNFIHYIKENLIYINRGLKLYFHAKFLNKSVNLKLPNLDKASYILNRDLIGLLYFSNVYMHAIKGLQFVYSSRYNGLSFQNIAQALEKYEAPTYIFFKVAPVDEKGEKTDIRKDKTYVIGGFSRLPWKNTGNYGGDSDCYIFSMAPKFKNFYALTNQTVNTNYTYLSTTGTNKGLGFGGNNYSNFRIWIDGTDLDKSYVGNEDNTYYSGPITEPGLISIKILEVEVWGFGVDFHGVEGINSLQRTSNSQNKTWITYNQSKVTELVDQSADIAKVLNQFDNHIAQVSREDEPLTRNFDDVYLQTPVQKSSVEARTETVKRSAPRPDDLDVSGISQRSDVVDDILKRNFLARPLDPGSSSVQYSTTQTTSYDLYNPFKGEQNVKITKSTQSTPKGER